MHRFFARMIGEGRAILPPEEAAHALRVLRMEAGDQCQALIDGRLFAARLVETRPEAMLSLESELPSPEPSLRVTLYQGLPKGDKMDYVVQKCTEAGVFQVTPVLFSRCVAKWDSWDGDKKLARWNRIAAEAAKQAGRALAPAVAPPLSLDALCAALPGHGLAFVPWEEQKSGGLKQWAGQRDVALVIGPEGGISPEEMTALIQATARPVTLGPRIFRTETAGLAAMISLLTISGDME